MAMSFNDQNSLMALLPENKYNGSETGNDNEFR